ncbi:PREDICTED: WD repeat-containing protein 88 [Chrysochloris asiatica]|uniref:WD repeat-containing protein 88 n=1 Tax=Chrysochloris asiatica TaxID=185453 RepID=A0A9B0WU86_CHRAS|nr:PREDICTED: WD repeat-containing protein 88 [Chrysochloris asiatica]
MQAGLRWDLKGPARVWGLGARGATVYRQAFVLTTDRSGSEMASQRSVSSSSPKIVGGGVSPSSQKILGRGVSPSSPKIVGDGVTPSSPKILGRGVSPSSPKILGGVRKPHYGARILPFAPVGARFYQRLPWAMVARAYSQFMMPISEAHQMRLLGMLDPLDVGKTSPLLEEQPVPKKLFWGDQEPLSKIPYKILHDHEHMVSSCHFCVDDTKILSGSYDCTVKLWDAVDGVVIRNFEPQPRAPVLECSVTADNKRILAASYDKTIQVWDLETGKLLWKVKHDNFIVSCKFSPDGKYVVSALDVDRGISLMDAKNGTTISHIKDHHKRSVTACCFDQDSQKVASVSSDRTVKILDVLSQATLLTITKAHANLISNCCFTFSGHFLCTSSWDKTLKIWNVHTGEFRNQGACVTLMQGHKGSVSSCQFSRDASFLVSGGFDKTVTIWDVGEGCKKFSLKGHSDWVMDVAISNNKEWILSASKDKTMRLWNIEKLDQIPLVIKYKKAKGLKVTQCEGCDRPFSIYESDSSEILTKCVFCRMDDRRWTAEAPPSSPSEKVISRASEDSTYKGDS